MGEFIPNQKFPEVPSNNKIQSFAEKIRSFSFSQEIKPKKNITRISGDLYGTIDKDGLITFH
ncbi:MAG: hypothetical protein PHQ59_00440 [Candidatus Daviesbacteria bacterium]|nr:hypothetical protein [Candidatus Daviesbacteria bacterium]